MNTTTHHPHPEGHAMHDPLFDKPTPRAPALVLPLEHELPYQAAQHAATASLGHRSLSYLNATSAGVRRGLGDPLRLLVCVEEPVSGEQRFERPLV